MIAKLRDIAPRLAAAHAAEQERRMDGISRCWQRGWHANGAGPCFGSVEQAIAYRNRQDRADLDGTNPQRYKVRNPQLRARLLWRLGEGPKPGAETTESEGR